MREKYLVFILGMILISVLFFMLAGNSLKKNLGEIENYDKKIKTTLEKLNSAMIMDQQLSQFREILDNSLTTESKFSVDELNNFQREIERLRDQNQMKLVKISDSNKFTQSGMIETTYTIELQGTFRQMGQFISELEAQNHIIKIQYLDVAPLQATEKNQASSGSANIYRITMELSIFKVKKEA
ncbi:MAG: type 4a pilus biogenesis protein PilO [Candidatus Cloacimonetes bacterium]|nr:type 4a pilus biogenesis protein PilO [Candidatus Cloacimonadota bacterium]MDD3142892.1 type 4a pilus biogenesis protein PilO [Candidatus Cloacimonadota bacterium]MDY0366145.1 type 4a pilus biogenesis protein PilO [Candidatus Syntrophosphaera sp.]HOY85201.1 type 4a pilus biogenesis protein PilO [Candidatus Syntrophosphaera sp.]